ncbi:MAG TPA: P-II family nitrogen regulator [Patescibacteria group bacterium]|nr:P-II family nitrogen regulator [Patescibacteria group bacterium]
MKKIEAIIRTEKLDEVKNALQKQGIDGMTISEVMGCGRQEGQQGIYRGVVYNITLHPRVKLEVILPDEAVDAVVEAIMESGRTGRAGDGKIIILPVEEIYRIRDRQSGRHAL